MPTTTQTLLELRVPLIVSIASRRATVDEVLALGPGAILEMDKSADEPLEILINNKPVGTGSPVKVGEKFGIRVTHIGSPRERAEALSDAPELSGLEVNGA